MLNQSETTENLANFETGTNGAESSRENFESFNQKLRKFREEKD